MTRDEILAATERQLQKHADEAVASYVFGSVARNTHRSSSDVDLAVLYGAEPPLTLSGLTHDVADLLQFTSAIRAALSLPNQSG